MKAASRWLENIRPLHREEAGCYGFGVDLPVTDALKQNLLMAPTGKDSEVCVRSSAEWLESAGLPDEDKKIFILVKALSCHRRRERQCNISMPPPFDLTACLDGVRRQDSEMIEVLIEHFFPRILLIVRSYRSPQLGEEALAEKVFLMMFSHLDQYQGNNEVSFAQWLSRLAIWTCQQHWREGRRRPEYRWETLSEHERQWIGFFADKEAVNAPTEPPGAREAMERLLAFLPPQDRLLITFLDFEERSMAEIAVLTGWGVSSIKLRVFQARRKLRYHAIKFKKASKL